MTIVVGNSLGFVFEYCTFLVKRINQHETHRAVCGRKASHFESEKRGKSVRGTAQTLEIDNTKL